jgi:hypothetical protein
MNLKVRYALEQQSLQGLYWVVDTDTDEVLTEPMPYDEAWHVKESKLRVAAAEAQEPVKH